jgi:hypothetical protein
VVERIEKLIEETKADLAFLGPPRHPSLDDRQYFMEITNKYQEAVPDAFTGPPDSWSLDDESEAKLNTRLGDLRTGFIDIVHSRGHTKDFCNACDRVAEPFCPYELNGAGYPNLDHFNDPYEPGSWSHLWDSSRPYQCSDIHPWLRGLYDDLRGAELPGIVSSGMLGKIFRRQTVDWQKIAEDYVRQVKQVVSALSKSVLEEIVDDNDLRKCLEARLLAGETAAFNELTEKVRRIVHAERGWSLHTKEENATFEAQLTEIRDSRVSAMVNSAKSKRTVTVRCDDITEQLQRANQDRVLKDIHDSLRALYPIAVCRFMNSVIELFTAENLCGPGGPLSIISPQFVSDLTDDEVAAMAGESMRRRTELTAQLDRLQSALDLLKEAGFSRTSIPYCRSANKRRRLETRETSPALCDEEIETDVSEGDNAGRCRARQSVEGSIHSLSC